MESCGPINTPKCAKDSIKQKGLKFDFGEIKSEKYGEASISGQLLFIDHEEIPPINEKPAVKKGYEWMKEMGLEQYHEKICKKASASSLLAYTALGVKIEKLEVFFKMAVFSNSLDDGLLELYDINENNLIKCREEVMNLIENLTLIIKSTGDSNITKAAITKVNPIFKITCLSLSYTCRCSFEQMCEKDYNGFAKELLEFIKVNKWFQEYNNVPYTKSEYKDLRVPDVLTGIIIYSICFAKNIRIPDGIRKHFVFRRYYKNVIIHTAMCNDIFSLRKEIAADEKLNIVLIYCQKYSLQTSIHKVVKAANELVIELQKDRIRLLSYFPTNDGLLNFLKLSEHILVGASTWACTTPRYDIKFNEICLMEYSCDYNNWLEQMKSISAETLIESELNVESDDTWIPSLLP